MADKKEPASETEASEEESEQALLPESFFQGKDLEIGNKCEVRIEGIYEGEVAVSYVPHKKKDKDGKDKDSDDDDDDSDSKPRRDSMDGALREMDMMAVAPPPSMGGY